MPDAMSRPGRQQGKPLSVWDLPASLLTSVHRFRRRRPKRGRERKHHAAILAFIYRNSFATASQAQRRFSTIWRRLLHPSGQRSIALPAWRA